jgi:hypothetical protein
MLQRVGSLAVTDASSSQSSNSARAVLPGDWMCQAIDCQEKHNNAAGTHCIGCGRARGAASTCDSQDGAESHTVKATFATASRREMRLVTQELKKSFDLNGGEAIVQWTTDQCCNVRGSHMILAVLVSPSHISSSMCTILRHARRIGFGLQMCFPAPSASSTRRKWSSVYSCARSLRSRTICAFKHFMDPKSECRPRRLQLQFLRQPVPAA